MRAVVVGGGLVGSTLAARLAADGHDVVVVEVSRDRLSELADTLDVQTVQGNGTTVEVLEAAGIGGCDVLIASTASDEANMVVALIGSAIFHVPRVVARLRDSDHERSFRAIARQLPGDHLCVNPDLAAVEKILSLLPVPGAADVASFLDGKLLIAGFPMGRNSAFSGMLLSHLRLLFPERSVLAVAIRRRDQWFIPHGEDEFREGDLVYFSISPAELDNVLELIGTRRASERRVMVAGATRVGIGVAARLEKAGIPVALIDEDRARCHEAAGELDSAIVLHGTPTDQGLLEEEGVGKASAFVACADNHQLNVVACLLARRLGAAHTFALVDNPALSGLVGEMGIDAVISPRLLTVGLAAQFVRRGRIRAAVALLEDEVELVEVDLGPNSRLTAGALGEVGLPRGVLVAALLRDGTVIVPGGGDRARPGDRAVLISTTERARELDAFVGS
ncbi:MAG TPA: Trk system potassium transporter TrkA [Thermoanaerobaculaceae bacterium]|nr:Trk system potassium transporter TrkA [Thermoanaerobaculaceae bacterium]HRS17669.1 Trk system potassium transporter TrkA [Thermoanaerobaculaceae bacterium]